MVVMWNEKGDSMTDKTFSSNGHKRAVLYARVSTDEQADNYSLPTQLEACRKYAEDNGFVIVGNQYFDLKENKTVLAPNDNTVTGYADDYSGATPIELRPEGRKAYNMLKMDKADCLIAYRVDRIARPPEDGDEWDIPVLIRGLAKLSREIHTVNRGQLKTDFASLLIALLDGKGAGEERRNIIERTRRGARAKAKLGKVVGCGRWPYGYRYTSAGKRDGEYVIVEPEAKIIRMIFDWYTGANGAPMTINQIAVELTRMGIPTPAERPNQTKRTRGPGLWAYINVYGILNNKTYIGVWRFGKFGRHGKNSEDNIIEVAVPPIISIAQWEAARKQMSFNSKIALRNAKHEYLLRGIVKCKRCGRTMVGSYTPNTGISYYRCPNGHSRPGYEHCPQKDIRVDVLDFAVWEYILEVMTDEEKFEQGLLDTQAEIETATEPKRAQLEAIEALIAETEAEADRLAGVLAQVKGKVKKSLEHQIDIVNDRYEAQSAKRDKILAEIQEQAVLTNEDIANAMKTRERIVMGLQNPTFAMKRQMLNFLRVEIVICDKKAKFDCMFKIERVIDLETVLDCKPNEERWVRLSRTVDLDEVSRAFFAQVGMSVEP